MDYLPLFVDVANRCGDPFKVDDPFSTDVLQILRRTGEFPIFIDADNDRDRLLTFGDDVGIATFRDPIDNLAELRPSLHERQGFLFRHGLLPVYT